MRQNLVEGIGLMAFFGSLQLAGKHVDAGFRMQSGFVRAQLVFIFAALGAPQIFGEVVVYLAPGSI